MTVAPRCQDRVRVVVIACGLGGLFALLLVQFFRIQVVQEERWSKIAVGQHFFTLPIPFRRGTFFSNSSVRESHPEPPQRLVFDILKLHLAADVPAIPKEYREEVAWELARILNGVSEGQDLIDASYFEERLQSRSRARRLLSWLDPAVKNVVMAWWQPYAQERKIARNALFFVADHQRSYPFGAMLGQALHTIRRHRDAATQQGVPTGGLELQFHTFLSGSLGERRLMRSPRNRLATGEVLREPTHGADVHLTVNHGLQAIAEQELSIGVRKAGAKSGWAAMMDPFTGEILVLAQYPFFDPSRYEEYFNDPEKVQQTKLQAITDAQEPGSVMKPITIAVALEANRVLQGRGEEPLFDPDAPMATADGTFPGRGPMRDVTHHKFLNMYQALQKSSNIYMARLAERIIERLGREWYRETLWNIFGFGQKTDIELPGESSGVLPRPGKVLANGKLEWSVPTPFSLAIGHNIQVTSLQILRAYALFANGGRLVQPTLLRKVVRQKEILLDHTRPGRVESFPHVLSSEVIDEVLQAMKFVTKRGGSGRRANVGGYSEAGKSGTARKIVAGAYSKKRHLATFVGFIPLNQPRFVLLVAIDEPEVRYIPGVGHSAHGGVCAAPVFREIARRSLEYLGVAPDDPHGWRTDDPRYDPEKADWAKELEAMAELYDEWNDTDE